MPQGKSVPSWSTQLTGGRWVTMTNARGKMHVYIRSADNRIIAGPNEVVGADAAHIEAHHGREEGTTQRHALGATPTGALGQKTLAYNPNPHPLGRAAAGHGYRQAMAISGGAEPAQGVHQPGFVPAAPLERQGQLFGAQFGAGGQGTSLVQPPVPLERGRSSQAPVGNKGAQTPGETPAAQMSFPGMTPPVATVPGASGDGAPSQISLPGVAPAAAAGAGAVATAEPPAAAPATGASEQGEALWGTRQQAIEDFKAFAHQLQQKYPSGDFEAISPEEKAHWKTLYGAVHDATMAYAAQTGKGVGDAPPGGAAGGEAQAPAPEGGAEQGMGTPVPEEPALSSQPAPVPPVDGGVSPSGATAPSQVQPRLFDNPNQPQALHGATSGAAVGGPVVPPGGPEGGQADDVVHRQYGDTTRHYIAEAFPGAHQAIMAGPTARHQMQAVGDAARGDHEQRAKTVERVGKMAQDRLVQDRYHPLLGQHLGQQTAQVAAGLRAQGQAAAPQAPGAAPEETGGRVAMEPGAEDGSAAPRMSGRMLIGGEQKVAGHEERRRAQDERMIRQFGAEGRDDLRDQALRAFKEDYGDDAHDALARDLGLGSEGAAMAPGGGALSRPVRGVVRPKEGPPLRKPGTGSAQGATPFAQTAEEGTPADLLGGEQGEKTPKPHAVQSLPEKAKAAAALGEGELDLGANEGMQRRQRQMAARLGDRPMPRGADWQQPTEEGQRSFKERYTRNRRSDWLAMQDRPADAEVEKHLGHLESHEGHRALAGALDEELPREQARSQAEHETYVAGLDRVRRAAEQRIDERMGGYQNKRTGDLRRVRALLDDYAGAKDPAAREFAMHALESNVRSGALRGLAVGAAPLPTGTGLRQQELEKVRQALAGTAPSDTGGAAAQSTSTGAVPGSGSRAAEQPAVAPATAAPPVGPDEDIGALHQTPEGRHKLRGLLEGTFARNDMAGDMDRHVMAEMAGQLHHEARGGTISPEQQEALGSQAAFVRPALERTRAGAEGAASYTPDHVLTNHESYKHMVGNRLGHRGIDQLDSLVYQARQAHQQATKKGQEEGRLSDGQFEHLSNLSRALWKAKQVKFPNSSFGRQTLSEVHAALPGAEHYLNRVHPDHVQTRAHLQEMAAHIAANDPQAPSLTHIREMMAQHGGTLQLPEGRGGLSPDRPAAALPPRPPVSQGEPAALGGGQQGMAPHAPAAEGGADRERLEKDMRGLHERFRRGEGTGERLGQMMAEYSRRYGDEARDRLVGELQGGRQTALTGPGTVQPSHGPAPDKTTTVPPARDLDTRLGSLQGLLSPAAIAATKQQRASRSQPQGGQPEPVALPQAEAGEPSPGTDAGGVRAPQGKSPPSGETSLEREARLQNSLRRHQQHASEARAQGDHAAAQAHEEAAGEVQRLLAAHRAQQRGEAPVSGSQPPAAAHAPETAQKETGEAEQPALRQEEKTSPPARAEKTSPPAAANVPEDKGGQQPAIAAPESTSEAQQRYLGMAQHPEQYKEVAHLLRQMAQNRNLPKKMRPALFGTQQAIEGYHGAAGDAGRQAPHQRQIERMLPHIAPEMLRQESRNAAAASSRQGASSGSGSGDLGAQEQKAPEEKRPTEKTSVAGSAAQAAGEGETTPQRPTTTAQGEQDASPAALRTTKTDPGYTNPLEGEKRGSVGGEPLGPEAVSGETPKITTEEGGQQRLEAPEQPKTRPVLGAPLPQTTRGGAVLRPTAPGEGGIRPMTPQASAQKRQTARDQEAFEKSMGQGPAQPRQIGLEEGTSSEPPKMGAEKNPPQEGVVHEPGAGRVEPADGRRASAAVDAKNVVPEPGGGGARAEGEKKHPPAAGQAQRPRSPTWDEDAMLRRPAGRPARLAMGSQSTQQAQAVAHLREHVSQNLLRGGQETLHTEDDEGNPLPPLRSFEYRRGEDRDEEKNLPRLRAAALRDWYTAGTPSEQVAHLAQHAHVFDSGVGPPPTGADAATQRKWAIRAAMRTQEALSTMMQNFAGTNWTPAQISPLVANRYTHLGNALVWHARKEGRLLSPEEMRSLYGGSEEGRMAPSEPINHEHVAHVLRQFRDHNHATVAAHAAEAGARAARGDVLADGRAGHPEVGRATFGEVSRRLGAMAEHKRLWDPDEDHVDHLLGEYGRTLGRAGLQQKYDELSAAIKGKQALGHPELGQVSIGTQQAVAGDLEKYLKKLSKTEVTGKGHRVPAWAGGRTPQGEIIQAPAGGAGGTGAAQRRGPRFSVQQSGEGQWAVHRNGKPISRHGSEEDARAEVERQQEAAQDDATERSVGRRGAAGQPASSAPSAGAPAPNAYVDMVRDPSGAGAKRFYDIVQHAAAHTPDHAAKLSLGMVGKRLEQMANDPTLSTEERARALEHAAASVGGLEHHLDPSRQALLSQGAKGPLVSAEVQRTHGEEARRALERRTDAALDHLDRVGKGPLVRMERGPQGKMRENRTLYDQTSEHARGVQEALDRMRRVDPDHEAVADGHEALGDLHAALLRDALGHARKGLAEGQGGKPMGRWLAMGRRGLVESAQRELATVAPDHPLHKEAQDVVDQLDDIVGGPSSLEAAQEGTRAGQKESERSRLLREWKADRAMRGKPVGDTKQQAEEALSEPPHRTPAAPEVTTSTEGPRAEGSAHASPASGEASPETSGEEQPQASGTGEDEEPPSASTRGAQSGPRTAELGPTEHQVSGADQAPTEGVNHHHVQAIVDRAQNDEVGDLQVKIDAFHRVAQNESYRPTGPDGQPVTRDTAAEAARQLEALRDQKEAQGPGASTAPPQAATPAARPPTKGARGGRTAAQSIGRRLQPGDVVQTPQGRMFVSSHHVESGTVRGEIGGKLVSINLHQHSPDQISRVVKECAGWVDPWAA